MSVATGATGDCDSQVCLVSARDGDDDSLSSVEDSPDMVDVGADGASPLVVQPASELIWGVPGASPLYQAMQSLVGHGGTTGSRDHHMGTPSAVKADELSHQLHQQVDHAMEQHGTADQKQLWKNATHDQQHEWIASFFLAALS